MERTSTYNRFSKDMDWSVRFLSIYNIDVEEASDVVSDIIRELSVVKWNDQTESLRQNIFIGRLKEKLHSLKKSSAAA